MCIYISPICNVEASLFSVNIIKIRDSLFSLFTWYQSPRENLIYFFGDRVSFQSLYSPSGTLRRRISPPSDLLAAAAAGVFSGRKRQIPRRTRPIYKSVATLSENSPARTVTRRFSSVACRSRAGACGRVDHFPVTGLHIQARPAPSCCSILPAVHLEPSLSTFLPVSAPPHSVS